MGAQRNGFVWPEADCLLPGCYPAKRTLTLSTPFVWG
jgi:hypothetical protein